MSLTFIYGNRCLCACHNALKEPICEKEKIYKEYNTNVISKLWYDAE